MQTPEEFLEENGYGSGTNLTIPIVASLMGLYSRELIVQYKELVAAQDEYIKFLSDYIFGYPVMADDPGLKFREKIAKLKEEL